MQATPIVKTHLCWRKPPCLRSMQDRMLEGVAGVILRKSKARPGPCITSPFLGVESLSLEERYKNAHGDVAANPKTEDYETPVPNWRRSHARASKAHPN